MRKGRFSSSWSPRDSHRALRTGPGPTIDPLLAASVLPRVASLQPAATAIPEKPLLSPWQRGEAPFDPFRRDARQSFELLTCFRFRLGNAGYHRGQGKRHRAAGACVAQDSPHTFSQTAVELNRPRDT